MKKQFPSKVRWATVVALLVAAIGVIIQIVSGVEYPAVPPVFFILLVPAALLSFTRLRWPIILAIICCIFLTAGLFLSGSATRLVHFDNVGGSIGLWIQAIAVLSGLASASLAAYHIYRKPSVPVQAR